MSEDAIYRLQRGRAKAEGAESIRAAQRAAFDKKMANARVKRDKVIASSLTQATIDDYADWLAGYLAQGGSVTHYYDYASHAGSLYVAKADFKLPALFGSASLKIIVPEWVSYMGNYNKLGHSTLYLPGDVKGHITVPSYPAVEDRVVMRLRINSA